jgi:hypothetical protein
MVRLWENAEELDFYIAASLPAADDTVWIWLKCSLCGDVQATASGEPSDLGGLNAAAQGHYDRKHSGAVTP